MRTSIMFLLVTVPVWRFQTAGAGPADSLQTVLVVTADVDRAAVTVNGRFSGYTPVTIDSLPPGACAVSVRHPSPQSWFVSGSNDTVTLVPGDTIRVAARLRAWYQLVTNPAGVPVYAGDSLIGLTPLLLPGTGLLGRGIVSLRPPGSPSVPVEPGGDTGVLRVNIPFSGPVPESRVMSMAQEERGIPLRLAITGGTALLSGVAAAAWKVRADEVYAEYRLSRDPAARDRTRRLDTSAAVALVAMQVSVGLFVYFLLSD